DPAAVLDFADGVDGPVVYKPLAGGGLCRRMTAADFGPERLRLLAHAPVMFQAEIPGRNIRVYVVAGRVVASYVILSDELDYRGAERGVLPMALSAEEEAASCLAAKACGMTFTGLDLRRRRDASFAVLECNPSPMFAAIERRTAAAPVSQALADVLFDG
ncbi:MAG: ATP-grasp domain-containing protein, partial [Pseudonocardia sp.]